MKIASPSETEVAHLRQAGVPRRYSISRTALYWWRKKGGFPEPVQLGGSGPLLWEVDALRKWEASHAPAEGVKL